MLSYGLGLPACAAVRRAFTGPYVILSIYVHQRSEIARQRNNRRPLDDGYVKLLTRRAAISSPLYPVPVSVISSNRFAIRCRL